MAFFEDPTFKSGHLRGSHYILSAAEAPCDQIIIVVLYVQGAGDLLAFETVPCILEVDAILSSIKSLDSMTYPAWISLSCKDGSHLSR